MRRKINLDDFIYEDFGDEIVCLQFKEGIYYSISGSGPPILRMFKNALSLEIFFETLGKKFGPGREKELKEFISFLSEENILAVAETGEEFIPDFPELISDPVLYEKFDDVSDLVKLDPIHDVTDLGWPNKKSE